MGFQAGREFIFLFKINLPQGLQVGQVKDCRTLCCTHLIDEHLRPSLRASYQVD